MSKYKFPSTLATHIVDEKNNMALDLPWDSTKETEEEWRERRELILGLLNDRKICPPIKP